MSPREDPGGWTSTRHLGVDAGAATLVALLVACQSQPRDVDGIVRTALERRSWPATSVLVVDRGRVLVNVGHRTPTERDPQDLVYPLGSIGKMFTAAALHRLAERGEVDLGALVAVYLPDWPPSWNDVRVHQLLGHTSGIPDFWFVPEAARLAGNPAARAIDLARVMAQVPLQFEPGTRFSYSNTACHAAARVIERRTGLSYDAYLAREFFTPMGMTSMHHCRGDAGEMAGHVLRDGRAVASRTRTTRPRAATAGCVGARATLRGGSRRSLPVRSCKEHRGTAMPRRRGCLTARTFSTDTASRCGHWAATGSSAITTRWPATREWSRGIRHAT
jgi:CubicO group peptidase (beta-lactamase class C family)